MSSSASVDVTSAPIFVAPITVRWRDLDAFNHVNNANYLTYLEEARLQWLQPLRDWSDTSNSPVLAASEVNYRQPITWPANLQVELRCVHLGNSSLALAHRIVDATDSHRLYSDGKVIMVWVNHATGKSVAIPQPIRDAAGENLRG